MKKQIEKTSSSDHSSNLSVLWRIKERKG